LIKRFYSVVAVAESEAGFIITLDGKPVRTPARNALQAWSRALAEAVAAEWECQEQWIRPATMPLTQLVSTAIDRVSVDPAAIVEALMAYGASDLLCYRADMPEDLVLRQEAAWQPLVDWAAGALGVEMVVVTGVMPRPQPPASLDRLKNIIAAYDVPRLTALQTVVAATGSLLLGVALLVGRVTAEETLALAQLDETFQAEIWGVDDEAKQRWAGLQQEVKAAAQLLALCSSCS